MEKYNKVMHDIKCQPYSLHVRKDLLQKLCSHCMHKDGKLVAWRQVKEKLKCQSP